MRGATVQVELAMIAGTPFFLSRLKNFGQWGRRGDGRHNDYLKYSSLNTT
jgi:hypothetical protein